MRNFEKGQTLILLLVFLPLLLLIFRLAARSSAIALYHDQIENHCNRRILDALALEAKGLEELGHLNPYARSIICARRTIDNLVNIMPELIPTQLTLRAGERLLGLVQKEIKSKTLFSFAQSLSRPAPKKFLEKIQESYRPIPLVNLHLKDEEGYEGEFGAPLQPVNDFDEKSAASGRIKIFTERFLFWWPERLKTAPDMILECKAQIHLKTLEDSWSAQLVNPVAKPLLNSPSL